MAAVYKGMSEEERADFTSRIEDITNNDSDDYFGNSEITEQGDD